MAYQAARTKVNVLLIASSLVSIAIALSLVGSFPEGSPIPSEASATVSIALAFGYICGVLTRKSRVTIASIVGLIVQLLHETIFTPPDAINPGILLLRFISIVFLFQFFNVLTPVSRILHDLRQKKGELSSVALRHINTYLKDRLARVAGLLILNYLLSLALLMLGGTLGLFLGDFLPSSLQLALVATCSVALALWSEPE